MYYTAQNNLGNNERVIEEKLSNIDTSKKNNISTTNNTESSNDGVATSSTCSDEENNNDTINKFKYTSEEWESLSVAKQVQILNQQKIDNYNKACREFDKKIESILKPYSGEYISLQNAMDLLNKYTNLEIEKEDEKSLLNENGFVDKDLIECLLKDDSKFPRPDYPILNTRVY